MAFNANFTSARLQDDGSLAVAGRSDPADGSGTILVSLVHGKDMQSVQVSHPQQDPWAARFPKQGKSFKVGDEVFVVGVALRRAKDPFVWQGGLEIKAETDA